MSETFEKAGAEAAEGTFAYPDEGMLWPDDRGTLDLDGRRALLMLIRGPFIDAVRTPDLFDAVLNHKESMQSRCNDLLCELVVDADAGIAFVRNARSEDAELPKATRNAPLTLTDTIMVLMLRRELLMTREERAIVGHDEFIASLEHYRPITQLDEAKFKERLERSWKKIKDNALLIPLKDTEDRFEISPALKVIFGVEEAQAAKEAIDELLEKGDRCDGGSDLDADDNSRSDSEHAENAEHDDRCDGGENAEGDR